MWFIFRATHSALEQGDERLAQGYSTVCLQDHPACFPLAKT